MNKPLLPLFMMFLVSTPAFALTGGQSSGGGGAESKTAQPLNAARLKPALEWARERIQAAQIPHVLREEIANELKLLEEKSLFFRTEELTLLGFQRFPGDYVSHVKPDGSLDLTSVGAFTPHRSGGPIVFTPQSDNLSSARLGELIIHEVLHHLLPERLLRNESFVEDLSKDLAQGTLGRTVKAEIDGLYQDSVILENFSFPSKSRAYYVKQLDLVKLTFETEQTRLIAEYDQAVSSNQKAINLAKRNFLEHKNSKRLEDEVRVLTAKFPQTVAALNYAFRELKLSTTRTLQELSADYNITAWLNAFTLAHQEGYVVFDTDPVITPLGSKRLVVRFAEEKGKFFEKNIESDFAGARGLTFFHRIGSYEVESKMLFLAAAPTGHGNGRCLEQDYCGITHGYLTSNSYFHHATGSSEEGHIKDQAYTQRRFQELEEELFFSKIPKPAGEEEPLPRLILGIPHISYDTIQKLNTNSITSLRCNNAFAEAVVGCPEIWVMKFGNAPFLLVEQKVLSR